jgi:hypothetical protein
MNELSPEQIEVDPPTCEQCGCVIEDLEALIHLRAAELVQQWERAGLRDAWRHTGEHPPKASTAREPSARPYCTPEATKEAFKYVASLGDADHLARWLADHPADAPELFKIWKGKR